MPIKQYEYVGKGKVWIRKRGATTDPRVQMGNVSKLSLKVDETKKELPDYTSAGGGNQNTLSRVKSVSIDMATSNLSPDNLAIGLRGAITANASVTAIVGETVAAVPGGLAQTARLPDSTKPMTVKNTAGTTTYADGTDYQRTISGIEVLSTGTITAGSIKIDYTPLADNVVEALVSSNVEYELVFEGLNEAQSGAPAVLEVHRIKFSPSGCDLIADDFGELKLSGDVLSDETKTGTGISKFFRDRLARLS